MRFYSANSYFRDRFGCRMYKASVSLDVTCPNRDGKVGTGGCIFCSQGGSGEFSEGAGATIAERIDEAIQKVSSKIDDDTGIIAYFQSFTNTYCKASYLDDVLEQAFSHPRVKAVSLGTRPDCLPEDIMKVLEKYSSRYPVFVELGLQTSNDETALWFNRCYRTEIYDAAVKRLKAIGVNVITHIIFGLKGESVEDMMESVRHAVRAGTDGVKFTCLYVLEGTGLYEEYKEGRIDLLSREEYFDIVEKALEELPREIVVHRLTGDGPKKILVGPSWTKNKRDVINYINRRFG